jgi:hypothetical protein
LNRKRHDVRLDIESNDMILIQIESNHYRIESQPNPIEPNPIRKPNPNLNPPLPANRVQPCPKPGMTTANRVQPCPKASPTVVNRAKPCSQGMQTVSNRFGVRAKPCLKYTHIRVKACPTVSSALGSVSNRVLPQQ